MKPLHVLREAWLRWCIDNAESELRELQRSSAVSSVLLAHRMRHIHSMRERIVTHRATPRQTRRGWRTTLRRIAHGAALREEA